MNFKLKNIKTRYAELWGNRRAGDRYVRLALVMRDDETGLWFFSSDDAHVLEFGAIHGFTYEFETRREAVTWLKRWYLEQQAARALANSGGFDKRFWRCPCRDALSDMRESGVFSRKELRDWREKMEASGK